MALVKETLKSGINSLLEQLSTAEDPAQSREQFAEQLATLIDTYIKSADVITTVNGAPVKALIS